MDSKYDENKIDSKTILNEKVNAGVEKAKDAGKKLGIRIAIILLSYVLLLIVPVSLFSIGSFMEEISCVFYVGLTIYYVKIGRNYAPKVIRLAEITIQETIGKVPVVGLIIKLFVYVIEGCFISQYSIGMQIAEKIRI